MLLAISDGFQRNFIRLLGQQNEKRIKIREAK